MIITILIVTLIQSMVTGEDSNLLPCSFSQGVLKCDSKNITNNSPVQFQTSSELPIKELEIFNFPFADIPSNYLSSILSNLSSIKIHSIVPIKSINKIAFAQCSKVTNLEIKSHLSNDENLVDLNEVFRDLMLLEDLKLININFDELKLGYLNKLKSLSIENSIFKSISIDTFQSNQQLSTLNIVKMKNPSDLMKQFSAWPSTISSPIRNLKLENCQLKSIPRFDTKFASNLTTLSLSKNPISQISDNDTMNFSELQTLSLTATELDHKVMTGLKMLKKLEILDLSGITTMKDLPKEIELMDTLERISIDMSELNMLSITLPSSIKRLSATHLKKPKSISSDFLSKCNQLHLLNLNKLDVTDINFLVNKVDVFKDSIKILNLEGSIMLLKDQLWKIIQKMRNLEILIFNKANIDSIPDNVLNNLVSLKKLYLQGNKIEYKYINTEGFQNISRHLTDLDLSHNELEKIPPCLFHMMPSLAHINILHNPIVCDCNILWLVEKVKSSPITYPQLNFTCTSGKSLYQLNASDFSKCSLNLDRCEPLMAGLYEVPFNLIYKSGESTFRLENINGSYLRFMFDFMKVIVKQGDKIIHSDMDRYELNRTSINMTQETKANSLKVCLTLVRNVKEYDYDYNCRTEETKPLINHSSLMIWIGASISTGIVIIIIIVMMIVVLRRQTGEKKNRPQEEGIYSEYSSQYSEPNDTYQNPDQYTEIISDEEYTINQKEAFLDDSFHKGQPSLNLYNSVRSLKYLANNNSKSVDGGLDVSYLTNNRSKLTKPRAKSSRYHSKRAPQFASLHNLNMTSLPRKYHSTIRSSLPQRYVSRDLPVPPENIPLETQSASPPPKPKFPSTDIKNLLDNADNHLNYFRNYCSNNSLYTDESANHPHSGDSGLGISKLSNQSQNRLSQNHSVII